MKDMINLCFPSPGDLKDKSFLHTDNFPFIFSGKNSTFVFNFQNKGTYTLYPLYWEKGILGLGLGNICIHPDYRGEGWSQKMLFEAESQAKNLGGDFLFLFSEKESLYLKGGYTQVGKDYFLSVQGIPWFTSQSQLLEFQRKNTLHLNLQERVKLWSFMETVRPASYPILNFSDFDHMMNIPHMEVMWNPHHTQAVGFLGKGSDFRGIVHGFYYKTCQDLQDLFCYIFHAAPSSVAMVTGISVLESIASAVPLCFFKGPMKLFNMIQNHQLSIPSLQSL